MRVGIVNYGVGNLDSVEGALSITGADCRLINKPDEIEHFDKLVLPGVGNFEECSKLLQQNGWFETINNAVINKHKPIFGICLGMQLLASSSTEVSINSTALVVSGLGLIPGAVKHLSVMGCKKRVPHVGWNEVEPTGGGHEIFVDVPSKTDFYFMHSYAFIPNNSSHIAAVTNYDIPIVVAVRNGNIWGAQFHPEKSSHAGLQVLKNFIASEPC